jgi:hypothetical protein
MWGRTLRVAEGLGEALRQGILSSIDLSILKLIGLYLRTILIYALFATILYLLAQEARGA